LCGRVVQGGGRTGGEVQCGRDVCGGCRSDARGDQVVTENRSSRARGGGEDAQGRGKIHSKQKCAGAHGAPRHAHGAESTFT
jgi:hypothetical protein